jgi:hypothetical protein
MRARIVGTANATLLAGGACLGRGLEAGFFLNDVSGFLESNTINVDTPIGGLSVFFDGDFDFVGLAIAFPSLGIGASATGPDIPFCMTGEWGLDLLGKSSKTAAAS